MIKNAAKLALLATTVIVGFNCESSAAVKARTPKLASAQAPRSFYCIAFPSTHGLSVPALPGYGHGAVAASQQAALDNCQSRSPFGAGANCHINTCYPE